MTLTHGGLFEGYGGTSQAARLALGGLRTRWVSDIKPASIQLLEHHHPLVPNLGDLTQIDYSTVQPVDVVTASWPCQPHSSAGKRLGEKDPRALWPEVIRAITALRPAIFLGENVARIASNGELRRVVRTLADLGYVGAWRCVRASDVGAPHRRDRGFVVAVDPAAAYAGHGGLTGAVGGEPHGDGGATALRSGAHAALTLLPTPTVGDSRNSRNATANRAPDKEANSGWTLSDVAYAERWGVYADAIARWEPIIGHAAPEPTMISQRTGKPQLAPPFVEWMMGVSAGHVTEVPGLTRNEMLSLLGDGVVPQQGAYAYRFMLEHLAERLAGSSLEEEAA